VFGFCLGVFALLAAYLVRPVKQPAFD
jgi:hypothetical protein